MQIKTHPIIRAAQNGNLNLVKELMTKDKTSCHETDEYGQTALLWAASNGNSDVVAFLIGQGAELNPRTKSPGSEHHGQTPLGWAMEKGHYGIANMLLDALNTQNNLNLDFVVTNKLPNIINAAKQGNLELVKLYTRIDREQIELQDEFGQTPLLWAAANGYCEIVAFLIMQGADLNISTVKPGNDHHRLTPLGWAVINYHYKVTKKLLDVGATQLYTEQADPTIIIAARRNYLSFMQLFLERNPTLIETEDDHKQTAVLWAAAKGYYRMVSLLIKNKADLNVSTYAPENLFIHSRQPLDWALENNNISVASLLYLHGATSKTQFNTAILTPDYIVKAGADIRKVSRVFFQVGSDNQSELDILPSEILTYIASFVGDRKFISEKEAITIADYNFKRPPIFVNSNLGNSTTADKICLFMQEGQSAIALALLKLKGSDSEYKKWLNAALEGAVGAETPDIILIKSLLARGAEANNINLKWLPSVSDTQTRSKLEVISLLMQQGGSTIRLQEALDRGLDDVVKTLLVNIKNFDQKNLSEAAYTLLVKASEHCSSETLELLLQKGANVNSKLPNGFTILMHAVLQGKDFLMHELTSRGAEILAQIPENLDKSYFLKFGFSPIPGDTVLDMAIKLNRYEVALELVAALPQEMMPSLLRNAIITDHLVTARFLLEKKLVDVNACENDGETALLIAVERDLTESVKLLVESGADCNRQLITTNEYHQVFGTVVGDTPLHIATRQDNAEIKSILIWKGQADRSIVNSQGETAQNISGRLALMQQNNIASPNDSVRARGFLWRQFTNFMQRLPRNSTRDQEQLQRSMK